MSFLLCLLLVASAAEPDPFARSTQLIVVATSDWSAVEGRLVRYERATPREPWRPLGEPIPIVVGKNGLGWGIGVIAADDPKTVLDRLVAIGTGGGMVIERAGLEVLVRDLGSSVLGAGRLDGCCE